MKGLRADLQNRNFTSVFGTQASFRVKELRRTLQNRNFTTVFGDQSSFRAKGLLEPHFVRKGCDRHFKIASLPQLLVIKAGFVRSVCRRGSQFYLSFWRSNLISCERVATDTSKSQVYLSFWRSKLVSCERVAAENVKSQFFLSFWRSNLVSCERVAFRAVSLALPRALREK